MDSKEQKFYHCGSRGDIVYSLPTIMAYGEEATLYIRDANHMNYLYDLLMMQDYIKDVKHRRKIGAGPYVNLSLFRGIAWKKRSQHLAISHLESQKKTYDISKPWLHHIEPNHVADIIVNRTVKYHDKQEIKWGLLRPLMDRCAFVGHVWEFKRFVRGYKLKKIPFYETKNGLEVAKAIKGSKLFIGNQSVSYALAEAMKHPRCLEVCYGFNNCQPHGADGHTYMTEKLIERYLNS